MATDPNLLLAGDIGGTKSSFALFSLEQWPSPPLRQTTYSNQGIQTIEQLIDRFLKNQTLVPQTAVLGIAGPIHDQEVEMTNLDWTISATSIRHHFGFEQVHLINDLVATAMGISTLQPDQLHCLNLGSPQKCGTIAILAPGTGLGEAILTTDMNQHPLPLATEGGHVSFAPRTEEQIALLRFLLKSQDHVSVEQVCSGTALSTLFSFLATYHPVPDVLKQNLTSSAQGLPPAVLDAALQAFTNGNNNHIAVHTFRLFSEILIDEAANLALKSLSLDGLYLGGGLSPLLLPFLDHPRFMSIFCRGVYSEMLSRVPVHIILQPDTATYGAAAYGHHIRLYQRSTKP